MRWRILPWLVVLPLLASSCMDQQRWTIRGSVRVAADDQPMAGARLFLGDPKRRYNFPLPQYASRQVGQLYASSLGRLPARETITVVADGFEPVTFRVRDVCADVIAWLTCDNVYLSARLAPHVQPAHPPLQ